MNAFIDNFASKYGIDVENAQRFVEQFNVAEIRKGDLIVEQNSLNDNFYILKDGIIRAFVPTEDGEQTLWFGYPGQVFFDVWCYHWCKPSMIVIEAVTPGVVYFVCKDKLERLSDRSHVICNIVRKIFEGHAAETEESTTSLLMCDNGLERYLSVLRRHPELLQQVPLRKLASYLQLAPQSLSRIRSQIK